jgi:hypothetical protein
MRSIDRVHTCGLEREDGKRAVGLRFTFEDGQVVEGWLSIPGARGLSPSLDGVAGAVDPAQARRQTGAHVAQAPAQPSRSALVLERNAALRQRA